MITIAGPTAVGKTDLSIQLAQKYNSDIFSADSRQLYTELNIGTAKPSKEELQIVKHHFINHISVEDAYNAGRYEKEIDHLFEEYFVNNNVGVMTGGTGMYIKAALEGLDDFPKVEETIKVFYEELLLKEGIAVLQQKLKEKDPKYAQQVDLSNTRRLIRSLSVIDSSGKPYSSFLNKKEKKLLPFRVINICLTRERNELYQRINKRVDLMMENGLLEEVRSLKDFQHLKSMQTVGYTELFKHLNGEISLSEAIALVKRNSRRYAKRQMTWFRNQGKWNYLDAEDHSTILKFVDSRINKVG